MSLLSVLTVIFVAASAILYCMQYIKYPAIPGYLLAGFVIAPFVEGSSIIDLAQVGVLFLVFIFGLKFDPEELVSAGQSTLVVAVLQLLVTGSLGYVVAGQLGLTGLEAFVVGVAAALSSTLVGLELAEQEIHRRLLHGRLAESMHLIQDVLGLVALSVIFTSTPTAALTAGALSVAFIIVALLIRRYVFTVLGDFISYNGEILMLLGFSTLLLSVYGALSLGLPAVIGAFAAGIAGAKFPYNMELLDSFGSIKDFFAAIFFVTLGALVGIPTGTTVILGVAVFIITAVIKPYVTAELFKHVGYTDRASVLTGLSMSQVSELTLILAIQGLIQNAISTPVFDGIILGGALSMFVSSYAKRNEEWLYDILHDDWSMNQHINTTDHIVIIGADLPGRRVTESLAKQWNKDIIVIDNDAEKLGWVDDVAGVIGVHGDVMNDDVLSAVNASDASLIVSTALQSRVSAMVMEIDGPDRIVYASVAPEARRFYDAGASFVIVPDLAVAEELDGHISSMRTEAGRTMLREAGQALLRSMYESNR